MMSSQRCASLECKLRVVLLSTHLSCHFKLLWKASQFNHSDMAHHFQGLQYGARLPLEPQQSHIRNGRSFLEETTVASKLMARSLEHLREFCPLLWGASCWEWGWGGMGQKSQEWGFSESGRSHFRLIIAIYGKRIIHLYEYIHTNVFISALVFKYYLKEILIPKICVRIHL